MNSYKWIYWYDQCKYCKNQNKTDSCERNQKFMRTLNNMYHNYLGTVDFKCDYFQIDEEKEKVINKIMEGINNE